MLDIRRPLLAVVALAVLSGCMISEQIGEPTGRWNDKAPPEDVIIHFDTQYNRAVVYGRSALLALVGVWIAVSWRKSIPATLLAIGLVVVAGWLVDRDHPKLNGYRLEVSAGGLYLSVPPEPEKTISWGAIDRLTMAGYEWGSVGGGPRVYGAPSTPFVSLPDWETMTISHDGQRHTVMLKELSIEHREIFAQALIRRAGLVKE